MLDQRYVPRRRTVMDANHGKYMVVLYTKPDDCGGKCLFCIRTPGLTNSTVTNQDTRLALTNVWSSAKQLRQRVADARIGFGRGHKFEFRIKGNSFTHYDPSYLENYIKQAYDVLNQTVSQTFDEAFAGQFDAPDRCVQIVVETRPDEITPEWCELMSRWGVTTVEIGVQSLFDSVLEQNHRGHGVSEVVSATRLIRQYGFELGYHVMLGLVGSSRDMDAEMLSSMLWTEQFYPDTLKIYPCVATWDERAQKPLYAALRTQRWRPYSNEEYASFLSGVVCHFPKDVHVNRLQRILTEAEVAHGPGRPLNRHQHDNISSCMWQRSVQQRRHLREDYSTYTLLSFQHGQELCLQAVTNNQTLIGYARLSLQPNQARVRDLRVLGRPVALSDHGNDRFAIQHRGVGRTLLAGLESIAQQCGKTVLIVNPAPGAAQYFAHLGYITWSASTMAKPLVL